MKKTVPATALVLSIAMFFTACSTTWVATLDSLIAAAAPALVNILQIVAISNGKPMDNNLAAKVNADAAAIKQFATDYASASAAAAPGACHQLEAGITVFQEDEGLILKAAQISDTNTQTKVILLASLVTSTVSAILAVIPSCKNAVSRDAQAPAFDYPAFAKRYNQIMLTPTGNPAVDKATPKLQLHRHSKFVRVLSFGSLQ